MAERPVNNASGADFEAKAAKAYALFAPIAAKYHFSFRRNAITCNANPCMAFLGNHSSGKSSMINWLLGEDVQDTGLAPTDDGFTFIMYGERDDFHGLAALERLPAEYAAFRNFGDAFVNSLRVKLRPVEFLKNVTLVDSPGMIDSAEKTAGRNYNFEGVVRALVELCDLVFYMFDPDKPGTTGETVNIFARCLSDVTFKLRILLNKCDGFSSLYDFARTYGTLCWNLARVLKTKDMPKIWTVYSGEERTATAQSIDLADFNRCRDEFRAVVNDGAAMRRDNLVSQSLADFQGLSIRMRMVNLVWRKCALANFIASLAVIATSASAFLLWRHYYGQSVFATVCAGALAVAVFLVAALAERFVSRSIRYRYADQIDSLFHREYRSEITIGIHDDILRTWDEIREETAKTIKDVPLRLPFFGEFWRKRLQREMKRLMR